MEGQYKRKKQSAAQRNSESVFQQKQKLKKKNIKPMLCGENKQSN